MSDSKLQKHSSLGRLSQSVGPKKKFESGINPYPQNTFKYAVLSGNNQELVKRVMTQTVRATYWTDMTHLCVKQPGSSLLTSSKISQSVPRKFVAGNVVSTMQQRPSSPLQVHFKWTPVSIKSDFHKLPSGISSVGTNNTVFGQTLSPALRPRHVINHFEFHKELTRKDELVSNLRT